MRPEKMVDSQPPKPQKLWRWRKPSPERFLRILAGVVFVLFAIVGLVRIGSRQGEALFIAATELGEFMLYAVCGLACGGLLIGFSALLRVLRDLHESFIRLEKYQYERGGLAQPVGSESDLAATTPKTTAPTKITRSETDGHTLPGVSETEWKQVIGLLQDIRDNALLPEQQRAEKKQRIADEELQQAHLRITTLTQQGQFTQAREIAEFTARRNPDDPRATELIAQVEDARESQEFEDVRACTRQVNDLISISAWGRVRELVQQLQDRHPDSAEARQLMLRVERENNVFQDEQRRRMAAEVQRCVTKRRWDEALVAAKMFIDRFPGCEESEALRLQLPTLEGNAEIETRQRLETRIMDYVKHGRYMEALDMARKVIEQFPGSPQADALRAQLERLEQLANDPKAPPARVRIE